MQMYFRLFDEDSFHFRPVNLCEHVHNLIHSKAVVYGQSGNASTFYLGSLQESRSSSRWRMGSEIPVEGFDRIYRNTRWSILVADDQRGNLVLARGRWSERSGSVARLEEATTMRAY